MLKFTPFHHSDLLMGALKLNTMREKLDTVKSALMIRLMNNAYTRSFTKELLKCYNGEPYRDSILHPMLNYISNNPLSRYLTTKKMTEYAKFAFDYIKQKCKNRFKYDDTALLVRGMLWNLSDKRQYLAEMLESLGLRF